MPWHMLLNMSKLSNWRTEAAFLSLAMATTLQPDQESQCLSLNLGLNLQLPWNWELVLSIHSRDTPP